MEYIEKLYIINKKVKFIHIKQNYFSALYNSMKAFNSEVILNYSNENKLKEILIKIRKVINKFFTTVDNYEVLLDNEIKILINDFQSIKLSYNELFDNYCKAIISEILQIQKNLSGKNFYLDKIYPLICVKRKQCIVVRFDSSISSFNGVPIIKSSNFLKSGIYYNDVFLIGSPDFFDSRLSKIFLADNTYFISYEFFQNTISKVNHFVKINETDQINTLYNHVIFEGMQKGELVSKEFGSIEEKLEKTDIILRHEKSANTKVIYEQIEANLILLSNKHYTFIPVNTKVRTVNREDVSIESVLISNLSKGDWILFRNNSNTDLVIEVANTIMSNEYKELRELQYKWKRRLKYFINKYSLEKVIRILNRNGITQANLTNIRNWLEPASIQPNNFRKLLSTLKFEVEEIELILDATYKIKNAHLKAGRQITAELIKELSEDKFEDVIENGYATFSSPLIPGASFNIETVTEIDNKIVTVSKSDVLTIWRG